MHTFHVSLALTLFASIYFWFFWLLAGQSTCIFLPTRHDFFFLSKCPTNFSSPSFPCHLFIQYLPLYVPLIYFLVCSSPSSLSAPLSCSYTINILTTPVSPLSSIISPLTVFLFQNAPPIMVFLCPDFNVAVVTNILTKST